jgi:rhodanese-related sulfurtransferase
MMVRSFLCLLFSLTLGQFGHAQTVTPHCNGYLFDQLVKKSISFSVSTIDVQDLFAQRTKYLVLDARAKEEFTVSHIEGALRIGYEPLNTEVLRSVDRNQPIAVYCSIGYRSEKVAEQLQKMGFTQVVNVYGSIFEWINRGYKVVDPFGKPTHKVHGYSRIWGIWVSHPTAEVVY